MTKKEISYIESDLEGILATQATKLDLIMQFNTTEGLKKGVYERIRDTLMYLHKNYKLTPKLGS